MANTTFRLRWKPLKSSGWGRRRRRNAKQQKDDGRKKGWKERWGVLHILWMFTEKLNLGLSTRSGSLMWLPCRILKIISLCVSAQREEEKQRQLKRQRELMALARQHHRRTLLLRRGLAPWKRLIQLRQASVEVNHLSCPFQLSVYSDTGSQQVLLYFWLWGVN